MDLATCERLIEEVESLRGKQVLAAIVYQSSAIGLADRQLELLKLLREEFIDKEIDAIHASYPRIHPVTGEIFHSCRKKCCINVADPA